MAYDTDIQLEHRFAKLIKAILGNQFITQDVVLDHEEGTDFLTMRVNPFRVGCRLRRYQYFKKYPKQFTLRWQRPSRKPTEIDKIKEGFVQYLLYGFVNQHETKIVQYFIGDLSVFLKAQVEPQAIMINDPPDSRFAIYDLNQFPSAFVLKSWPSEERT